MATPEGSCGEGLLKAQRLPRGTPKAPALHLQTPRDIEPSSARGPRVLALPRAKLPGKTLTRQHTFTHTQACTRTHAYSHTHKHTLCPSFYKCHCVGRLSPNTLKALPKNTRNILPPEGGAPTDRKKIRWNDWGRRDVHHQ